MYIVGKGDLKMTTIKPVGYHYKLNSRLKALWNANFYEPKPNAFKKYIDIDASSKFEENAELRKQIEPFKSIIGNFAKSINKQITLRPIKYKGQDAIFFNYGTIGKNCKNGEVVAPFGIGTIFIENKSKRSAIDKVFELLESIAKK